MATTTEYYSVTYIDAEGQRKVCGHTHIDEDLAGTCARTVTRELLRKAFPKFPATLSVDVYKNEVVLSAQAG